MHGRKIEIAVIGCGITGASIVAGLQDASWLEVTLYEASPRFDDSRGQNFGLGPNAIHALGFIHPALEAAVATAGGHPLLGTKLWLLDGPEAGKNVFTDTGTNPAAAAMAVMRSRLVKEIRELIEDDSVRLGKKLVEIKETMGIHHPRYQLSFADGTSAYADAVIGADGVHSISRFYVSGHGAATKPYNSGIITFRKLIDKTKALEIFGQEYIKDRAQNWYIGDNYAIFSDWSDNGDTLEFVLDFSLPNDPWPFADNVSYHTWSKEWLRARLVNKGEDARKILQVFINEGELIAYPRFYDNFPKSFSKGGVCLAGDALCTMSPAAGQGANSGIKDALALVTVLKGIRSPQEVDNAFKIYNQWRKADRFESFKVSASQAEVLYGRKRGIGLDAEKIKRYFLGDDEDELESSLIAYQS
jgi:salicylate hydroxylase